MFTITSTNALVATSTIVLCLSAPAPELEAFVLKSAFVTNSLHLETVIDEPIPHDEDVALSFVDKLMQSEDGTDKNTGLAKLDGQELTYNNVNIDKDLTVDIEEQDFFVGENGESSIGKITVRKVVIMEEKTEKVVDTVVTATCTYTQAEKWGLKKFTKHTHGLNAELNIDQISRDMSNAVKASEENLMKTRNLEKKQNDVNLDTASATFTSTGSSVNASHYVDVVFALAVFAAFSVLLSAVLKVMVFNFTTMNTIKKNAYYMNNKNLLNTNSGVELSKTDNLV